MNRRNNNKTTDNPLINQREEFQEYRRRHDIWWCVTKPCSTRCNITCDNIMGMVEIKRKLLQENLFSFDFLLTKTSSRSIPTHTYKSIYTLRVFGQIINHFLHLRFQLQIVQFLSFDCELPQEFSIKAITQNVSVVDVVGSKK